MTRLIDADALKENAYREGGAQSIAEMVVTVSDIDDAPTVQAFQTVQDVIIEIPVRHGRWEDCSNGWMCSECGDEWSPTDAKMIFGFNYCPNCGARMVGGKW